MEIKPFRAYRFNPAVVGSVGDCIAPPYDVISNGQQQELYEKSPYNIVRITRGKTYPQDDKENNQYTRAAQYLNQWIAEGVLKQDTADTVYAYVQGFTIAADTFQRFSFIASAKLEPFGQVVRPHERTLNEPIIDRLNLKRATVAKFGLVFMLYDDQQHIADRIIERIAAGTPLVDFHDDQNVRHRLFAITEKGEIDQIVNMMKNKSVIIADGHHRYTTGLTYAEESTNPAAKYQMLAFANVRQRGLLILATHRLVGGLKDFSADRFVASLKNDFELTEYRFDSDPAKADARIAVFAQMKQQYAKGRNAFGIYCADNHFILAVLKNTHAMDAVAPKMSTAWRSLDVSVLVKLIFERLLGIGDKELAEGTHVQYVKDIGNGVDESIQQVDGGQKQLVFFLNPTRMHQVEQVTAAGERMPQKSTYFYPKIFTGLTISKL